MNILFVTIAWPEDGNNLYTDLVSEFKKRGHRVAVVCNRERRVNKPNSFKKENGIDVLRINSGNIKKAGIFEKGISLMLLGWRFRQGVKKYLAERNFDMIIFNTPPVTLSGFLESIKKRYNCLLYILLKDIWPYSFADFGIIKKGGLIYKYIRSHEEKVFQLADFIGCMSQKGVEFVLKNYPQLNQTKVKVCPNSRRINDGIETIKHDIKINGVQKRYGIPEEATVFIFSGNLGLGHGLNFLVEVIIKLKDYRKAYFLIGGAGTHFLRIKKIMDIEKPPNAFMYSYLPDDEFKELMSICDVGLILLDSKYSYPQFPSRLLGYLNAKMAVLCSINSETDIGEIVERNGAGICTVHGNEKSFIEAVKRLSEDKELVKEMGINGFNLLVNEYSVDRTYEIIMSHSIKGWGEQL